MTPLHGIACFYDVGFGARAVSRKTPIYFINFIKKTDVFLQENVPKVKVNVKVWPKHGTRQVNPGQTQLPALEVAKTWNQNIKWVQQKVEAKKGQRFLCTSLPVT